MPIDGCGCPICSAERAETENENETETEIEEAETMLVKFVRNPIRFWPGKPCTAIPSRRTMSAEIEISTGGGTRTNAAVEAWSMSVVYDGSVSDGAEINTSPASGEQFVSQIGQLCDALGDEQGAVDSRCGLHLHVDCGDYGFPAYLRLLWVWAHIESAVYSTLPRSRRTNSYCAKRADQIEQFCGRPRELNAIETKSAVVAVVREQADSLPSRSWVSGTEYVRAYTRKAKMDVAGVPFVQDSTIASFRPKKLAGKVSDNPGSPGGGRYFGLNLQSAFKHGTIEFRCHGGTIEADKIVPWAAFCSALLDFAKRAKIADIERLYSMRPWDAFLSLVPTIEQRAYFADRRAKFGTA